MRPFIALFSIAVSCLCVDAAHAVIFEDRGVFEPVEIAAPDGWVPFFDGVEVGTRVTTLRIAADDARVITFGRIPDDAVAGLEVYHHAAIIDYAGRGFRTWQVSDGYVASPYAPLVPEPATVALILSGLVFLVGRGRGSGMGSPIDGERGYGSRAIDGVHPVDRLGCSPSPSTLDR